MAVLVIAGNPFDVFDQQRFFEPGGQTLGDLARVRDIDPKRQAVICNLSGRFVLQRDWSETVIGSDDIVQFVAVPQGSGGKNPLAIILQVALLVAAVVLPPIAGAALGASVAATIGVSTAIGTSIVTSVTAAAILAGGTLLINAVVPPQSASGLDGADAVSPTYSLGAQGNQARLNGIIPVIYGRHRVFPDFAATPYWRYENNDQYLYQLHVVGQGEHVIRDIRLGDTPVSVFEEVETQIVNPGEQVSLVATDIYTSPEVSGQALRAPNDLRPGHDGWLGPFAACPPGRTTQSVSVDIIAPGGLFLIADNGGVAALSVTWQAEARIIDDAGAPVGDWGTLFDGDMTGGTERKALRRSNDFDLPSLDRWEVRIRRTDDKNLSARAAHEIVWGGLRADLQGVDHFDGLTMIAIKMRATDNLNQSTSRRLNCIASRKLPVYDGNGWGAPVETSSIAWIAADILRNPVYGGGADDDRIDLDGLLALDAIWQDRGDYCNGVFDTPTTVWEALSKVLRCGRTRPYHQGGMIRFHRDSPQSLPVMVFSAENIVLGSFKMEFALPVYGDAADGIELQYIDERTWKPARVTAHVEGDAGVNPARENVFGITDRQQALREAQYQARSNRYRRRFVSFETELEGLIPSIGDLLLISHHMPEWGESGQVVHYDPASHILTLDRAHEVNDQTVSIRLRRPDGGVTDVLPVSYWDGERVKLAGDPGFSVHWNSGIERTHYIVGRADDEPVFAICLGIVPRGNRVQISAVLEDSRVHINQAG